MFPLNFHLFMCGHLWDHIMYKWITDWKSIASPNFFLQFTFSHQFTFVGFEPWVSSQHFCYVNFCWRYVFQMQNDSTYKFWAQWRLPTPQVFEIRRPNNMDLVWIEKRKAYTSYLYTCKYIYFWYYFGSMSKDQYSTYVGIACILKRKSKHSSTKFWFEKK